MSSELVTLISSMQYPAEFVELIKYKFNNEDPTEFYRNINNCPPKDDEKYIDFMCYHLLGLTSRSFARVIQELTPELKDVVCVFYLVLRGLDTIEDDMTIEVNKKADLLKNFHKFSHQKGWTFTESGPNEKDRILLEQYDVVIEKFLKLHPKYQKIIDNICLKMGEGMSEFCLKKKPSTIKNYYLYTYYVAGLVGIGLSEIFAASGLEDPSIAKKTDLSDSMGRFLQKTNIIRDFLEDYEDGRQFWPDEAWKKFIPEGTEGDIGILLKKDYNSFAMATLNYLCIDAFQHVVDVLEYLSSLKDRTVFNFCAIPQLMAISTLALVFNNPEIFKTKGVKTRKGEAVRIIRNNPDISSATLTFFRYITIIQRKGRILGHLPLEKENFKQLDKSIKDVQAWVRKNEKELNMEKAKAKAKKEDAFAQLLVTFIIVGIIFLTAYLIDLIPK
ncbi:farnesyl-diphosphate farnesyltransferase [Piromyces finnis]|uniref:squalene synthase n=1 Tax=Piromyces finnis TaxID=1754191 RepID=A0A1Y1VK33_9FUNG|nr:farnesyl-diphosphate farnesyltransferase [Piromyces finnis]|eukprot:ORX57865.1 farnesyl-diphosphate farnesyltransferase [Piromyces finnis]